MVLVVVGVVLLALKLLELGPVAAWPLWGVLLPFGLAVVWWAFADRTGYYKRREMRKMDAKAQERRARNLESLRGGKRR